MPVAAETVAGRQAIVAALPLQISVYDRGSRQLRQSFQDLSLAGWPLACDTHSTCAWEGTPQNNANRLIIRDVLNKDGVQRELGLGSDEAIGLSLAGPVLAAALNRSVVRIWSVDSGRELPAMELKTHVAGTGLSVAFDPVVQSLLSRKLFVPTSGMVTALVASADGAYLAAANDSELRVCNTRDTVQNCRSRPLNSSASVLAISGERVFWVDGKRFFWQWRFDRGSSADLVGEVPEMARFLKIRDGEKSAVVGLRGGGLELWDLTTRKRLASVSANGDSWLAATPTAYSMPAREVGSRRLGVSAMSHPHSCRLTYIFKISITRISLPT